MGRKKREYTYDDWKKAMDLHRKYKFRPAKISRILGINKNTVKNWLYYGRVPPMARWKAEPSNELGYAIGVLHRGDGCVSKDESRYQYKIRLATIDPDFAETFSRAMSRVLGVNYHKPWWVIYKSKAFYEWYKRCEEQGLQGFKQFIEHDLETVKYYLRGLYDSEGYNYRCKQIFLCNSNIKLLKHTQYLLLKYFSIIATGPYLQRKTGTKMTINGIETTTKHDYYRIQIRRKEHVQKFLREIGFSIVRKQLGLRKHEKVLIDGRYVEPYKLVELGLFKLPFNQ